MPGGLTMTTEELKRQYEELLDNFHRCWVIACKCGILELSNDHNLSLEKIANRDIFEYGAAIISTNDDELVKELLDNIVAQVEDPNERRLAMAKREAVLRLDPQHNDKPTALERINSHTPFPIKETLERFGLWDGEGNGI
jgi:hypothetical protein